MSFQEFEGSTVDAWEECDDDVIKISSSPIHSEMIASEKEACSTEKEACSEDRNSSLDAQVKLREMEISGANEPRTEVKVSDETEMKERQPKAGKSESKHLKNSVRVKQAIVSKLSETIGENVNCFSFGMFSSILFFVFGSEPCSI